MRLRNAVSSFFSYQRENICNLLVNIAPDGPLANTVFRPLVLRAFGLACGPGCKVWRRFYCTDPSKVRLGANVLVNRHVYVDSLDTVEIGENVAVGFRVSLITSSHRMDDPARRAGELVPNPIVIGDGCWIGAGALIGPGVTLGSGCVVSAGSVVMRSMPASSLVAGNPARVVRKLGVTGSSFEGDGPGE